MDGFQQLGQFLYGLGSFTWISVGLLIFILSSPKLRAIFLANLNAPFESQVPPPGGSRLSAQRKVPDGWWNDERLAIRVLIGTVVGIPAIILVSAIIMNL